MKKVANKLAENDVRAEYDFSNGVRGKHHHALRSGYTITIHQANGKKIVKRVDSPNAVVVLAPDVQEFFPDAEAVNTTLRSLIRLVPNKQRANLKKQKG